MYALVTLHKALVLLNFRLALHAKLARMALKRPPDAEPPVLQAD